MVVSKSRSSASLTVIAPVPELMANGRFSSPSPLVLPAVMDQVRPSSSPVVETVTTAAFGGGGLGEVGRGVGDGRRDVGDRDRDVLGVGSRAVGGPDGERVARCGLEVEVVGVVDGDSAVPELMANGSWPSVSPSVLPAVMDQVRPSSSPVVETVTTAAEFAAVSARLAEVSVTMARRR